MILGHRKDTGKWELINQFYTIESVRPEGAWDEVLVIPKEEGHPVDHYKVRAPQWQRVTYALGEKRRED